MVQEPADIELIAAFRNGNEQAFNTLYFRYRQVLYGFLNNLLPGNSSEVDEIFSDTWLRVIDKLPQYRDKGRFSAWLFRLARNIFIDRYRKTARRGQVEISGEVLPDTPDWSAVPHRAMEQADLGNLLAQALASLPLEQREVFLLRQEKCSFKEIAEVQECSVNTVLGRMHYALKSLRKFIRAHEAGERK